MRGPAVVVAARRGGCVLAGLLEAALRGSCDGCALAGRDGYRLVCGTAIAGRVLRSFARGDGVECWVKLSGVPRLVSRALEAPAGDGVRLQTMVRMRYGALLRLSARDPQCGACLSLSPPPGVLPKMSIVVPGGRVEIFFLFEQRGLQEVRRLGYEVLRVEELELSDYVLTPLQEYVLYRAYEQGRYEYPRRVRLSELAEELNISTPTLAEILRRAESKIMDAFIAHHMPHYYVMRIARGALQACHLLSEVRRKRGDGGAGAGPA